MVWTTIRYERGKLEILLLKVLVSGLSHQRRI
jgi:hypothetical protein